MPTLLGVKNRREYYLSDPDPVTGLKKIVWRFPNIREAFRPRPGYKLLIADYSQIEVKIMAELSGDLWLTAALNSGKDLHCFMAAEVYGVPYDEFYHAYKHPEDPKHDEYVTLRSNVKGVTFGVPYGAGPGRIAATTGLSFDAAADLIDRFFAKARGLKAWLRTQGEVALRFGHSTSLGGRKRFYERTSEMVEAIATTRKERRQAQEFRKEEEAQIRRRACNQPVQSSCVDILKKALVKIYLALRGGNWTGNLLYDARVLLCIHDEIIMEAREDQAEAVAKIMKDCMEDAYSEIVKTVKDTVEVTIADYWTK